MKDYVEGERKSLIITDVNLIIMGWLTLSDSSETTLRKLYGIEGIAFGKPMETEG